MRKVFAHRYKWSHDKRRKQLRKACKEGLVTLLEESAAGFLYHVPEDMAVYDPRSGKLKKGKNELQQSRATSASDAGLLPHL